MFKNLPETTTSLSFYLSSINSIPVLTREQEQDLARKVYDFKDISAAQKLIISNLRFVVKIANEYKKYGFHLMDIIQEGNVGLMLAIKKFNPYKGIKLISYAVWWIRAYIQNFILRNWSIVKIGTTQLERKLFYAISKTKKKLLGFGDGVDFDRVKKLASSLNTDEKKVSEMITRTEKNDVFLNLPLTSDGTTERIDLLEDSNQENLEEELSNNELKDIFSKRLKDFRPSLNERQIHILDNRLLSQEPATLQSIADKYGISKERARQLEDNLKNKIAKEFENLKCEVV
ncbi:MAG: RNA polymerase factor sigma-32 [Pseudomonadota bacterium]